MPSRLILITSLLTATVLFLFEPFPIVTALPVWFGFYFFAGFQGSSQIDRCPLRWRSVAIWVGVILFAHAWWIVFFRLILTMPHLPIGWERAAAAFGGIVAGLLFSLRRGYQQCSCSLATHSILTRAASEQRHGFPGQPLITRHPELAGIVARSFGWKPVTLHLDGGWHVEALCTGRKLISMPHFSYGTVWSDHPEARLHDLDQALRSLHFDKGFSGVEVRVPLPGTATMHHKTASWLPLAPAVDEQRRRYTSNLRRKISKAARSGYTVKRGGEELLPAFYKVYVRHMQSLGSAALPMRFLGQLLQKYQPAGVAEVFLVQRDGQVVGGAVNLAWQTFYENCWFATLHPVQPHYVSYLLHDTMIARAIELRCTTYSFGRSTTGGGVHRFKQQWGTTDVPLLWIQWPRQTVNIRKLNFLSHIWKHIPPPLNHWIGSYIAKWVH